MVQPNTDVKRLARAEPSVNPAVFIPLAPPRRALEYSVAGWTSFS